MADPRFGELVSTLPPELRCMIWLEVAPTIELDQQSPLESLTRWPTALQRPILMDLLERQHVVLASPFRQEYLQVLFKSCPLTFRPYVYLSCEIFCHANFAMQPINHGGTFLVRQIHWYHVVISGWMRLAADYGVTTKLAPFGLELEIHGPYLQTMYSPSPTSRAQTVHYLLEKIIQPSTEIIEPIPEDKMFIQLCYTYQKSPIRGHIAIGLPIFLRRVKYNRRTAVYLLEKKKQEILEPTNTEHLGGYRQKWVGLRRKEWLHWHKNVSDHHMKILDAFETLSSSSEKHIC